jgi:EpsI family protein
MDGKAKTRIIAGIILAVFAAAGNHLRFSAPPPARALGLDDYRMGSSSLTYEIEPIDNEFLALLGAREVSFRTYRSGEDERVWVFLGHFDRQREGSQVHSPKHCYPGSGWTIQTESTVAAPWGEGRVKRLVVSDGVEERLVYYWFQTDDRVLNNVFALKFHLTQQAMLRQHQEVVFARISTTIGDDVDFAESTLREYSVYVERVISGLYIDRGAAD